MSELRFETLTMPGAQVGPDNPLPPLKPPIDVHAQTRQFEGFPEDMVRNINYGRVSNPLPYTMQDRYTRQLEERSSAVAVLENEILKATFVLELGGRMWSILHKPSGRHLLEANPVFQPANLAIRNAWFSGGTEWNIGTIGHCPFTCSPLFAARAEGPDGTPALRLWEWERIRGTPFQIDAYLPAGSPVLLVRGRITNPNDEEVAVYWWSNTAVPESEDTRVLVPADAAFKVGYGTGGPGRNSIPEVEGTDVTYTTNVGKSCDFFFDLADGQRRWISALDGEGRGLVQTSTDVLRGRKLFMWGQGQGGRTWQTFLSRPGHAYVEIQAGLARTQMEHLPMPAGAVWEWQEAYGLMEADPRIVHGQDWDLAWREVEGKLEGLFPRQSMEAELERSREMVDREPLEIVQRGSGWGALEQMRRQAAGAAPMCRESLVFDEASLDGLQAPWQALLEEGALGEGDAGVEPTGYMVQPEWQSLLEQAVAAGKGTHWLAWLHLGVMRYWTNDRDGAKQAWEQSLAAEDTAWARRNLAMMAREDEDLDEAANQYLAACRLRPSLMPLATECAQLLLDAGRPQDWLDLLPELDASVQTAGRIRLQEGRAALAVEDFGRVGRIFEGDLVIDDLREGERSLSHLWFEYHEQRLAAAAGSDVDDAIKEQVRAEFPVPEHLDFRMSSD